MKVVSGKTNKLDIISLSIYGHCGRYSQNGRVALDGGAWCHGTLRDNKMKVGDLVKITKEFGGHWLIAVMWSLSAGMTGIFLGSINGYPTPTRHSIPKYTQLPFGFSMDISVIIDVPHVWVEVISESW